MTGWSPLKPTGLSIFTSGGSRDHCATLATPSVTAALVWLPDDPRVCPTGRCRYHLRLNFSREGATRPMATDIHITVTDRAGRKTASSGSKWEPKMGYSRAVRSGNIIAITGTVGVNADGTYSPNVGEQTARALAIIQAAIEKLGGKMEHVIRTRMFVTDVSQWEQVAKVH